MFCMHCGKEISDQAAFCTGCGNKVERPAPAAPAAPVAPVVPETPVAPVTPAAPVAPVAPAAPVAPVAPAAPVAPVAPVAETPVAPVAPAAPAAPAAPVVPVAETPIAPVAPAAPAQPVYAQTTAPVTPPAPAQPAYPQQPYAQPVTWQQPTPPAPKKGGKAWLVVLIIVLVLAIVGGTVAGVLLLGGDDDSSYSEVEGGNESEGKTSKVEANIGEASKVPSTSTPAVVLPAKLTQEILVGTWATNFTMDEMLAISGDEESSAILSAVNTDASIDMQLCFYEDGSFEMLVEETAFIDLFEDFMDDYVAWLRDGGVYDMYAAQGYSREMLDEMLAEQGMTVDDVVDQFVSSMDASDMAASATESFVKRDGVLVVGTDAEYTLSEDAITIVSPDGTEEQLEYEYEDGVITVTDTVGEGLEVFVSKELVKCATPR